MKKTLLLLFLLPIISFQTNAQDYSPWHFGKLYLDSGEEVRGKVSYSFESNMVKVKAQDKIKTYSAFQLKGFKIYGIPIEDYVVLRHSEEPQYRAVPQIFRVISEGEYTLLSRNKKRNDYRYFAADSGEWRRARSFSYDYLMNAESQIIKLGTSKKSRLRAMEIDPNILEEYIRSQDLNIKETKDMKKLIEHCNKLVAMND